MKWRLSFWNDIPDKVRTSKQGHINVGANVQPQYRLRILRSVFESG